MLGGVMILTNLSTHSRFPTLKFTAAIQLTTTLKHLVKQSVNDQLYILAPQAVAQEVEQVVH